MMLVDLSRIRKGALVVLCAALLLICLIFAYRMAEVQTSTDINEIQYKNYSALGGEFYYKLPSAWKTTEQDFGGSEIIYHNDFLSEDRNIHGFVEVWNLNMPLIDFIKEGRKNPIGIASFKNYTIEDVKINGREGYILHYSRAGETGKYTKAFEVFIIGKGNTFYRFSFFMDETKWKNEYRMFFLNIAASANKETTDRD